MRKLSWLAESNLHLETIEREINKRLMVVISLLNGISVWLGVCMPFVAIVQDFEQPNGYSLASEREFRLQLESPCFPTICADSVSHST